MSNQPPALSDAHKLRAVLEALHPQWAWNIVTTVERQSVYAGKRRGEDQQPPNEQRYAPTSLDDFRRVLLAASVVQRENFGWHLNLLIEAARTHMDSQRPQPDEVLTAPTSTILDALYRAVTNQ